MVKYSPLWWNERTIRRIVEERSQNIQYSYWMLKNGMRINPVVDCINGLDTFRGLKVDENDAELCEILDFAYILFESLEFC